MKEKISSLVDAELSRSDRAQVLGTVSTDPGCRSTWERYHLIGAAIRREVEWTLPPGFAERVAEAIGQEPAGRGHPGWVPRAGWGQGRSGWAARLAIAASVAGAVLFGIRANEIGPAPAGTPLKVASRAAQEQPGPATGNEFQDASFQGGGAHWEQLQPQWQQRINAFLLEHNEVSPEAGGDNLIGYVRIVGYDRMPRTSTHNAHR